MCLSTHAALPWDRLLAATKRQRDLVKTKMSVDAVSDLPGEPRDTGGNLARVHSTPSAMTIHDVANTDAVSESDLAEILANSPITAIVPMQHRRLLRIKSEDNTGNDLLVPEARGGSRSAGSPRRVAFGSDPTHEESESAAYMEQPTPVMVLTLKARTNRRI